MEKKKITEDQITEEYLSKIGQPTNTKAAEELINSLYEMNSLNPPKEIIRATSPRDAHRIIAEKYVEYGVNKSVEDYKRDKNGIGGTTPLRRGGLFDFGYIAYFDMLDRNDDFSGEVKEEFITHKDLVLQANLYDWYGFEDVAIFVEMPMYIKHNGSRRHNDEGPAAEWADGYKRYTWNGVDIDGKFIENPEAVTYEDISDGNVEVHRIYREALGAERYYNILGQGLEVLDKDIDHQGNEMILYKTELNDPHIENKVTFLHVECPSTGRIYDIYPPDQQVTNVWAAKASTFSGENLAYRQGDVGLVYEDPTLNPEHPYEET